ncbi:MAG: hydrogenase expression/formation protein [Alphaproteobacteria bacterium CG_4_10_14_0_2_um_filter_63_37]|nr:MAG: hypothetical protein AUJ55_10110 [Proteobacteria bacterium CG1_02_64_396]PJA24218.1 MAG: hydrogenase expression/formation protein [Alphaproteobacteria bacterium CG_4_10_14_0_2_um_filter_63_37]
MLPSPATRLPIVVLGIGNTLMGDEALGVRAVEALQDRFAGEPSLTFLDGGTMGLALLPWIESADRLLICDAVSGGQAPGFLYELHDGEIPAMRGLALSLHQIGLQEMLALCALRDLTPARMVLLGLEPKILRLHRTLSDPVTAALPGLIARGEKILDAWQRELDPLPTL